MSLTMPKWRRRSQLGVAAAAAAALLALSACGGDADDDSSADDANDDAAAEEVDDESDPTVDGDFRNGPVPDSDPVEAWEEAWEDSDEQPDEPADDEPLSSRIAHALLVDSAEFTKDFDSDGVVECPEFDDEGDYTCDATYFGHEYQLDVEVTGTGFVASYNYEAHERVVSRDMVEDALRFDTEAEDVFCPIEEYELIDPDDHDVECVSSADGEELVWELSLSMYGAISYYPV